MTVIPFPRPEVDRIDLPRNAVLCGVCLEWGLPSSNGPRRVVTCEDCGGPVHGDCAIWCLSCETPRCPQDHGSDESCIGCLLRLSIEVERARRESGWGGRPCRGSATVGDPGMTTRDLILAHDWRCRTCDGHLREYPERFAHVDSYGYSLTRTEEQVRLGHLPVPFDRKADVGDGSPRSGNRGGGNASGSDPYRAPTSADYIDHHSDDDDDAGEVEL